MEAPRKFPFVMTNGSALIPSRFWEYVVVRSTGHALALSKEGFVPCNKRVEDIEESK